MQQKNTISEEQRKLNIELHQSRSDFGSTQHAGGVAKRLPAALNRMYEVGLLSSYLDFGCGKGKLLKNISENLNKNVKITGYDPAVEEFSDYPNTQYDVVSCLDVLEHIEINLIDNVIDDILSITKNFCFVVVDLQPAVKKLSDGRNAHILLAPPDWWVSKFNQRFTSILNFPIYHVSGNAQKVVILATNKPKMIQPMILFATKLKIFQMFMANGVLGKGEVNQKMPKLKHR